MTCNALGTARRREVHGALALAIDHVRPLNHIASLGVIAWHAEEPGERVMAYRHAVVSTKLCERRFAAEEALVWLDLAAGTAATVEQSDAANRTTARLLEGVGGPMCSWHRSPPALSAGWRRRKWTCPRGRYRRVGGAVRSALFTRGSAPPIARARGAAVWFSPWSPQPTRGTPGR